MKSTAKNITLILTILMATLMADAASAAENCSQLSQELKSMHQAQKHLLDSMSKKDQDFATVLRQQSNRIENHIPKKSDAKSLANAATAYEQHGKKQTELVERFKVAADALLEKVQTCLNSTTPMVSSN